MKSKVLHKFKIIFISLIILFSILVCVSIISVTSTLLSPYYSKVENQMSDFTVSNILLEKYPSAYTPYKELDHLIYEYEYIQNIYKVNFPQKMPLYVYLMSSGDLINQSTYLVIFNDEYEIEDIIFLDENRSMDDSSFFDNMEFVESLLGYTAHDIELGLIDEIKDSKNYILSGVRSAALNLIYEVK